MNGGSGEVVIAIVFKRDRARRTSGQCQPAASRRPGLPKKLRNSVADVTMNIVRGLAMSADAKTRFRAGAKVCSVAIMVLLVVAALGPAKWAPRTELGWQFDHFIGYFGITLFFCIAWPRPVVVGGIVMAVAALLESLQALTPDRLISRPHSGAQAEH